MCLLFLKFYCLFNTILSEVDDAMWIYQTKAKVKLFFFILHHFNSMNYISCSNFEYSCNILCVIAVKKAPNDKSHKNTMNDADTAVLSAFWGYCTVLFTHTFFVSILFKHRNRMLTKCVPENQTLQPYQSKAHGTMTQFISYLKGEREKERKQNNRCWKTHLRGIYFLMLCRCVAAIFSRVKHKIEVIFPMKMLFAP